MTKTLYSLIVLLTWSSYALIAQTTFVDQLQKDPKVTWMAHSNFEYSLEGEKFMDAGLNLKGPIKQGSNLFTVQLSPELLQRTVETKKVMIQQVVEQMLKGTIPVSLRTDKQRRPLSKEIIRKKLEPMLAADGHLEKSALPDKIIVSQIWYYHQKKDQLQVATLGIVPVFLKTSAGKKEEYAPFFLPYDLQSPTPPFELDKPRFTWAKTSYGYFKNIQDLPVLKGNTTEMLRTAFWNITDREPLPQVYSRRAWSGLPPNKYSETTKLLSREDLLKIKSPRIDSVITFHPTTYEEQVKVITNPPYTLADLNAFRFCQIWYYDDQLQRLCSTLKAVGPSFPVKDANGNLRYHKTWYYALY